MDSEVVVEALDIEKSYALGRVQALRGISLAVEKRAFLALAGPSGSGKTTLLNILGGLDLPDRGTVRLDGIELDSLDENARTRVRRERIGFIFQQFNLIPVLTARENVELPLEILPDINSSTRRRRARETLELVGLKGMEGRHPSELSGGQQQRVAVARALVKNPTIVLADEPTANLDGATGAAVVDLMKRMRDELGTTFIFSTHDQRVIDRAEILIRLVDGKIQP